MKNGQARACSNPLTERGAFYTLAPHDVRKRQVQAAVAQQVERIHGKDEVSGSIPDRGSTPLRSSSSVGGAPNEVRRTKWGHKKN